MIVSLNIDDKTSQIEGESEGCGCCSDTYRGEESIEAELVYNLDIIKEYCNLTNKNFNEFLETLKQKL